MSDWGGIHGNAKKTIRRYISDLEKQEPKTPLAGVSSYSKIYAIAKPHDYAIYDSRVAASLNALQLLKLEDSDQGLAFPYVQSRNRAVARFQARWSRSQLKRRRWTMVSADNAYTVYLKVLRIKAAPARDNLMQRREMLLPSG